MLRHFTKILSISLLFSFMTAGVSFCQDATIIQLVDKYTNDTDVQKAAVEKEYLGKKITVSGIVTDVSDENTFDIVNDVNPEKKWIAPSLKNT